MTARQEELVARDLLDHPGKIGVFFQQKRWKELAALVRYARREVPVELAQTDPALYRRLRGQITRFFLLGGDAFCLEALEAKAGDRGTAAAG
jgi:hypothetical protein